MRFVLLASGIVEAVNARKTVGTAAESHGMITRGLCHFVKMMLMLER